MLSQAVSSVAWKSCRNCAHLYCGKSDSAIAAIRKLKSSFWSDQRPPSYLYEGISTFKVAIWDHNIAFIKDFAPKPFNQGHTRALAFRMTQQVRFSTAQLLVECQGCIRRLESLTISSQINWHLESHTMALDFIGASSQPAMAWIGSIMGPFKPKLGPIVLPKGELWIIKSYVVSVMPSVMPSICLDMGAESEILW